jgi:hypothetical protein
MRLQALGVIDIDKTNKIITFGAPLLQSVAMNRFNTHDAKWPHFRFNIISEADTETDHQKPGKGKPATKKK